MLAKTARLFVFLLVALAAAVPPAFAALPYNSVTSSQIVNGAIKGWDIANSTITGAKIADGSIGALDLAWNSVTSAKIANGSILAADLATGAVTSAKIADGSITNADISAAAAIAGSKISGAVNLANSANNSGLLDGLDSTSFVRSDTANGEITADSYKYASAKTGYLTLGSSEFRPTDSSYPYIASFGGFHTSGADYRTFAAPFHLPQGAVIEEMTLTAKDNDGTYNVFANLAKNWYTTFPNSSSFSSVMAAESGSDWAATTQTVGADVGIIDNSAYSYYVGISLHGAAGANTLVGQVRLRYSYASTEN